MGLPPSLSRTLTAPLVEAFRERFAGATLTVVEGLSTYLLEWLAQGRVDCAAVYNATRAAAIELQPVLEEGLYLVSARGSRRGRALLAPPLTLAEVAARELVIPSRPHAIRMKLETALAAAGLKPRVALEIESVPAILDLVQHHALHAVLSLNAIRASGAEAAYTARPIALGAGRGGGVHDVEFIQHFRPGPCSDKPLPRHRTQPGTSACDGLARQRAAGHGPSARRTGACRRCCHRGRLCSRA